MPGQKSLQSSESTRTTSFRDRTPSIIIMLGPDLEPKDGDWPDMTDVGKLHESWCRDPEYQKLHDARRPEFELASELIGARVRAGLSQAELAERMGPTQRAIVRMEAGRNWPSHRILERLAAATGTRLVLKLVDKAGSPVP